MRRSATARWCFAAVVLACAVAAGCRPPAAAPPKPKLNVILILVDTLRADRLNFYGYGRETAPHLTQLAKSGVVLRGASSQAGCTFPSANTILTSRWPQHFINRQETYGYGIPPDTPSLAEILHQAGYSTAAVSASIIVRATPSKINAKGGFGRGFDSFDESCPLRAAPCVNEQAEKILPRLREPFFLYLHYIDPHEPYQPPRWHENRFATEPSDKPWVRRGEPGVIRRHLYNGDKNAVFDQDDIRHLSDLYDEEIYFLDSQLDLLFTRLRQNHLLERSLVVFLSDHGEEIYDHQNIGHCRDLAFENILRTPFVVWMPGQAPGSRDQPAFNVDLVPTVLDLLGMKFDPNSFAGKSLRRTIEDNRAVHDVVFAAQGSSRVASDGRYKIILTLGGDVRAYDLRLGESKPLADVNKPEIRRLRAALLRWLAEAEGTSTADSLRRAKATEAQLRALGYL
jgi:arylsulfatase